MTVPGTVSLTFFLGEAKTDYKEGQQRQIKASVGGSETCFEATRVDNNVHSCLSQRYLKQKSLLSEMNSAMVHLANSTFEQWTLMCLMLRWRRGVDFKSPCGTFLGHPRHNHLLCITHEPPHPPLTPVFLLAAAHVDLSTLTLQVTDCSLFAGGWGWRWFLTLSHSSPPLSLPRLPSPTRALLARLVTAGPLHAEIARWK